MVEEEGGGAREMESKEAHNVHVCGRLSTMTK